MKTSLKVLHWLPRILCIAAILFVSMFAADAYNPDYSFWQLVQAYFMHLIPSFILLLLLIVAWKWELIGGIFFASVGIIFSPFLFMFNYRMNHSVWISLSVILMITVPFAVIGLLFMLSYYKKKQFARQSASGDNEVNSNDQ